MSEYLLVYRSNNTMFVFLLLSLFQIVHAVVDVYGMANVISISSPSAGRHYFTFSVFRMSLVSQANFFFFYTITIPTINSCFCFRIFLLYIHRSLISNKSFLFFFFFQQMLILLLPEYWSMENHICQSPQ